MIPMSMSPMQINTKFVNHLQPEWSRFVIAAKQARNLHKVNFDQLYAFLKHNERDVKEVREMPQRFPNPLALMENTSNPPHSYHNQQIQYHSQPSEVYQHYQSNTPITQQLIQSPPLQSYAPTVNVHGRQSQDYAGSARKNQATRARVVNTVGNARANQPRVIRCYNCNGEGHIAKQYIVKKMVKDSEWFKDKMLLAQAQKAGVILNDEQHDFLADSLEETDDCEDLQLQATTNFKANHVYAYDSDCYDKAISNAIFMANLSHVGSINDDTVEPRYDSDIFSEVPHYDTYHETNVLNPNVQEMGYIENIVSNNESSDELTSNNNVISYADYMVTIGNDVDNYVPPLVQNRYCL
ncbi:retrovirus-related pol polyprotein from transposon TNT 1-94 [Tanacetum coccineum]